MKEKFTNDLKHIFRHCKNWAELEVEYIKLTASEKISLFLIAITLVSIFLLIGMVLLIILALCLVDVFKMLMTPWLACLSVGGVLVVLMILVFLLRTPLIVNPITKFVSRLILGK